VVVFSRCRRTSRIVLRRCRIATVGQHPCGSNVRHSTLGKSETEVFGYRGVARGCGCRFPRHTTHEVRKNPLLGGLLPTFPLHQIARDRDATRRGADFRHRRVMSTKLPATENRGLQITCRVCCLASAEIALAASVAALVAPAPALAANFTVSTIPPDPNSTTAKTVTNNDTGTVQSGAALTVTGTAITWTGGSASPGVTIGNSGTITGTTRAIDTSGAFTTGTISLINRAGASITGTGNDAFRINTNITNGTVSVNNSGTILSNGGQTLDFAAITSANREHPDHQQRDGHHPLEPPTTPSGPARERSRSPTAA